MKFALYLLCVVCFFTPALRSATPAPLNAFEEANKLYEEKQYSKASHAYENLLRQGNISAAILFNAGNAAFKVKELGHAIARYREAQTVAPRDPDIRANLKFARNTVDNGPRTTGLLDRFGRVFTLNELTILTTIALWLWFGLLALREWRPHLRPVLRGYTLLSGLTLSVVALWLAIAAALVLNRHDAVVIANEAAVRFGPLDESQVAFTLRDGAEVEVLATRPGWTEIKDPRGRHGWVAQNNLESISSISPLPAS